jgi:hypothetical protein
MRHPAVKESVIVSFDEFTRDSENRKSKIENPKSLVAYVVPRDPSALSVTELRRDLKDKLPEYMVPSAFVMLESLPVSPNGKVDRRQLPSPYYTRLQLNEEFVAPRTEIEELIAQTWREVLKIENIGIFDNFFEMGGHSLLATQIATRLQEAFNKEVPLRVLFDAPTIAELAQELARIICDGHAPELPPIVPVLHDKLLPLSVNQEHLWRLQQMMPGTHFFNMPYVYQLTGELNVEALEKALQEIARRHDALRTTFDLVDDTPFQFVGEDSGVSLQALFLRMKSVDALYEAAATEIFDECRTPFDLLKGPLWRVKLLTLADVQSLLLVTMHHIISDYWSMRTFRRELLEFYGVFVKGHKSQLSPPRIQMGDYAVWERSLIASGFFEEQIDNMQLEDGRPPPEAEEEGLPSDRKQFFQSYERQVATIDGDLYRSIKNHAKQNKCTPCIITICALCVSLYKILKDTNIRIATLTANRGIHVTENAIGHFANTVVLSVNLTRHDTYGQALLKVRTACVNAYANQTIPFEYLVQTFRASRCSTANFLPSVLFNYHRHDFETTTVADLCFSPFVVTSVAQETEILPSSFDFILDVKETETLLDIIIRTKRYHPALRSKRGVGSYFRESLRMLLFEPLANVSVGDG